jgi:hypothetical protein
MIYEFYKCQKPAFGKVPISELGNNAIMNERTSIRDQPNRTTHIFGGNPCLFLACVAQFAKFYLRIRDFFRKFDFFAKSLRIRKPLLGRTHARTVF